ATHAGRERLLTDYHSIYEGFITLFIANADGTILDLVPPPDAGTLTPPIADRQYFVDAIQTRALTISDVIIGRRSHVPIVTIAAPLVASDGRVAGVAGGSLNLSKFQRFVEDYQTLEDGTITILDQHDRVIYSSPTSGYRVLESLAAHPMLTASA